MKQTLENKEIDELLKEKKVICLETATKEELNAVLQAQLKDEEWSGKINPDLVNYDPASKYINY